MIFMDGHNEEGEPEGYIFLHASDIPVERTGTVITPAERCWTWEPLPPLSDEELSDFVAYHNAVMTKMIAEVVIANYFRKYPQP